MAACHNLFGLGKYNIIGFVSIVDVSRAKDFYRDTLGLRLVMEEPPFALVFDANGIMLRLGMAKEIAPAHGTVLGWQVPEINATVKSWHKPESNSSAIRVWIKMNWASGLHPPGRRSPGSKTLMGIF